MGTMLFQLPANLSPELARELERACVIGGPDNMPWPTSIRISGNQLSVNRDVDESGSLLVPWEIDGAGRLMTASATLMERDAPYQFQLELARGKINQLRSQAADWRGGGLQLSGDLAERIQQAGLAFGRAATSGSMQLAQDALALGFQSSEQLVRLYIDQVFQVRHQRQPQLDTLFSCRLGNAVLQGSVADEVLASFNAVHLPIPWKTIEPSEAEYCWDAQDAMLDWAIRHDLHVTAGPLVDFSPNRLPGWLRGWERDLHSIESLMSDFVATVVQRYHDRIRSWQLTSASNCAAVLSLTEDELLWLTVRLAEAARQVDSGLELIIGLAQPWGDYMAGEDRTHSPFIFADTLIRTGLNLAAVDLEWIMGVDPHGSYCRDLLDASRLLDLYALLGVPLQVTLGYPSSNQPDPHADLPRCRPAGHWHNPFSPAGQADWAEAFASLSICKPYVRGVSWVHLSDAEPHLFPHCGLIDASGTAKPALQRLARLRQQHLR